jgi:hypothetical protein
VRSTFVTIADPAFDFAKLDADSMRRNFCVARGWSANGVE